MYTDSLTYTRHMCSDVLAAVPYRQLSRVSHVSVGHSVSRDALTMTGQGDVMNQSVPTTHNAKWTSLVDKNVNK